MGSTARGAAKGRARMLGGTQGCSGVCTSVQKLVHKCSKMSCWLVAQAGWAPGRHLGGQGSRISFYSLGREGKELMRAGGFTLFPLDGDGGIAEHTGACLDAPAGSTHAHPWPLCVLQVGAVLGGCHSLVLLGDSGLTGSLFSGRCCRTARRPAGKWSCTGGHRNVRTSSASWMSTRTSTRGGSVCSSSWSGESPVVLLQVDSPHWSTCSPAGRC